MADPTLMVSDGFGLNKLARLAAKAAKERVPPLDPEFPFFVVGFDEIFFGAEPSLDGDSRAGQLTS